MDLAFGEKLDCIAVTVRSDLILCDRGRVCVAVGSKSSFKIVVVVVEAFGNVAKAS
jgi:hypothetical protein